MDAITLPGLPGPGAWNVPPVAAYAATGVLTISAGPLCDLFSDPQGAPPVDNAPRWTFAADAHFTLAAHVQVDFAATFDAGVLVVWADATHWAKLCFEFSPQGEPMIVSVVNNGVSDDCNSVALARREVWLRVTRLNPALAFHYSLDGVRWQMVRYFTLATDAPLRVGCSAQSPTGQGCTARFAQLHYTAQPLADLRSGL